MKRITALFLAISLLAINCLTGNINIISAEAAEKENTIKNQSMDFTGLDDPRLLQYIKDSIYSELEERLSNDDYIVEDISTIYISKEYLEEVVYNSKSIIYFGYMLEELNKQFQGRKYVFTTGDSGKTMVKEFQDDSDNAYKQILRDVAIGSGIIFVCVIISVVAQSKELETLSVLFAVSAKTGRAVAMSSGVMSAVSAGIAKAKETKDFEQIAKTSTSLGSEKFKWGAVTGTLAGGLNSAGFFAIPSTLKIPSYAESEKRALEKYPGETQKSYWNKEEVAYATPGSTRPDIVRLKNGHLEAIEVKNYDLENKESVKVLYKELYRQVSERVENLPDGSTQRIVLDIKGRDYSKELMDTTVKSIQDTCRNVYPNLPVDIMR